MSGAATTRTSPIFAARGRTDPRPVVLLSNRGPVSFRVDDAGELVARRGAGGLVSGLAPLVDGTDAVWIAAAMSDGDRAAADRGVVEAEGLRVRLLALDPSAYRRRLRRRVQRHALVRPPRPLRRRPAAPPRPPVARGVGRPTARSTRPSPTPPPSRRPRAPPSSCRTTTCASSPRGCRAARPDLRLVHFSHTPFATPEWLRALPDDAAVELLEGLAAHHACAFHTQRWADAFMACCRSRRRHPAGDRRVAAGRRRPTTSRGRPRSEACAAAGADLDASFGDRQVIVRVDRVELSKNLLRGFHAYDHAARGATRVAGAGRVRRLRLPVAGGPAGVPRLPQRGRGAHRPDQRPVGHAGLDADRL